MKTATFVIPFRGEYAAIYKGWMYPFRKYLTADEFLRECWAGHLTDDDLEKFERYAS